MKFQIQIGGVTIASDNQQAQEKVVGLLFPHFTHAELVDAVLSITVNNVQTNQALADDLKGSPEARKTALAILKSIHEQ